MAHSTQFQNTAEFHIQYETENLYSRLRNLEHFSITQF